MLGASVVVAVIAVLVLAGTGLWTAPRLRRSTRLRFGTGALTVLSIGLTAGAVLVVIAIALRLSAG